MADSFDIPPIPNLCSNQQSMNTWIQYVNYTFDLSVKAVNEAFEEEFELPGIPYIEIPGLPPFSVPAIQGYDRPLLLKNPPRPKGWIGNQFPMRNQNKIIYADAGFPSLPGFNVPGTKGFVINGTDPTKVLIEGINRHYEIMAQILAEQGIEFVPTPVPYLELCPDGTGQTGTVTPGQILVNQIIDEMNRKIDDLIANVCVNTLADGFTPFTDPAWETIETNVNLAFSAVGTDFLNWNWDTFPGGDPTDKNAILQTVDQLYTGLPPSQLASCGNGVRIDFDYSIAQTLVSVGSATAVIRVFLYKMTPSSVLTLLDTADPSVFNTGSISGSDSVTAITGSVTDVDRLVLRIVMTVDTISDCNGVASLNIYPPVDLG